MFEQQAEFLMKMVEHGILPGTQLLLGISGGSDSVLMMCMLMKTGFRPGLAHVNYQLRGKDAEADEQLVRQYAEGLGLPLHVLKADPDELKKEGKSLQDTARKIRFDFFEKLMNEEGYQYTVLAHHKDDQAENMLMSLLRGNSTEVFKAMEFKRDRYIRPMLNVSKKEILEDLENMKVVKYRHDASNDESEYLRNQIRNEVMPSLAKINPSVEAQLADRMAWYQLQSGFIKDQLDFFYFQAKRMEKGRLAFDFYTFEKNHSDFNPLMWAYAAERLGLHGKTIWELVRLEKSQKGKFINTRIGKIWRTEGGFEIEPDTDRKIEPVRITDLSDSQNFIIGHHVLELNFPVDFDFVFVESGSYYLNAEKLVMPLRLRKWEKGDRMKPLGMNRAKKISDILTDLKVSPAEKAKAIVLEDQEKIVWLSGFRISNEVKVSGDDLSVLEIKELDGSDFE